MKCAILAGGFGSRLGEETLIKPKPMVEIGGKPILWHIMKHYTSYGINEFTIALGYKAEVIKRYFLDYHTLNRNYSVDITTGNINTIGINETLPPWKIDLIDTGLNTMTGGRIKQLTPYMGNSTFLLTWGDGVSNINIEKLIKFHRSHGKLATVTAVHPPARFGHLELEGNQIVEFSEKPQTQSGWINGAFFVLEPGVFDYIENDDTHWEKAPLEKLAQDGQLMAYKHTDFWQCMDTIRDKVLLEKMWAQGDAPWKTWQ